MIKKTELMIGNYVIDSVNNVMIQIGQLKKNCYTEDSDKFEFLREYFYKDAKPVEINLVMLQLLGFEWSIENQGWKKGDVTLYFATEPNEDEVTFVMYDDTTITCPTGDVKYVHNLQNLYYALTYQELG